MGYQMTSTRTKVTTALVALLVVLGGGSVVMAATGGTAADTVATGTDGDAVVEQDGNETTTAAGEETTTTLVDTNTVSITFQNQTSNGTTVFVDQAVLPEGGFVVVYRAQNVTGNFTQTATQEMLGQRIGNSTFLEPGVQENVTIRLDQPINESQVLIASLHRDTNNNRQFDPALEHAAIGQPDTTPAEGAQQTTTPAAEGTETTTPAAEGTQTTTAAMEGVDAAYTLDEPVLASAFVRVEGGAAVETTTVANETTTEAA